MDVNDSPSSTWYEVLRVLMICLCAEQGEEKEIGEDGHQDLVEEVNSHSLIVVASFSRSRLNYHLITIISCLALIS